MTASGVNKEPRKMNGKLWPAINSVLAAVIVGIGGLMIDLKVRIGKIESNRFTIHDWIREKEKLPPKWFVETIQRDLLEIKQGVARLDKRIVSIEDKIK